MTRPVRGRSRVPAPVIAAIAAAWLVAVAAELTGRTQELHHDALIERGPAFPVALALFILAWQVMIAAMMLPSSLPLVGGYATLTSGRQGARAAVAALLAGYALAWSVFGVVAFIGDAAVHHTVDAWPWLAAHPWLIAGGALATAGGFQFTSLKDRCLRECRHPGAFLLRHYRRGTGAAFAIGARHGLACVGCCWALMLVMFAAGVANLWWMAALTALMVFEKTAPRGERAVPVAGLILLALAAVVLTHPAWLPPLLGGGIHSH